MSVIEELDIPLEGEVFSVDHEDLPENSYILRMESAQKIHSNPLLWGEELRAYTRDCSNKFFRTAQELVPELDGIKNNEISEVVILRGGLAYQLDSAFSNVFDSYLPRCFVGARRHRVTKDEFEAELSYSNFEPLPDNGVVVIGDTIATGASVSRTIAEVRDELRKREKEIKSLIVFSAGAAFRGCSRLSDWIERFREWWPDFDLHVFVAEAFFGLDSGTHLRYRKPGEAIVPETSKEFVNEAFGDYEDAYLPGNICAIFDWGDRNFKPDRHLKDVLQYSKVARKEAEDKESLDFLRKLEKGAKEELKKFKSPIKQ